MTVCSNTECMGLLTACPLQDERCTLQKDSLRDKQRQERREGPWRAKAEMCATVALVLAGDMLPALMACLHVKKKCPCFRREANRLPISGSWGWETVKVAQVKTP